MNPHIPILLHSKRHEDARGSFTPIPLFDAACKLDFRPMQLNVSVSRPDVVRGMHWQGTTPQAKLITVLSGSILDVVVDLNKDDERFGQISCYYLLGGEQNPVEADILYVPKGYAHGFRSGPDGAVVLYAVDAPYDPSDERGFSPMDIPSFGDVSKCVMSEKDRSWPRLRSLFPDACPPVYPLDGADPSVVQ